MYVYEIILFSLVAVLAVGVSRWLGHGDWGARSAVGLKQTFPGIIKPI